ncbi:MAG: riboflavin synthase [Actinomycetota bacterium]|nr:riboflavin synthase [Acidimicrobiaceae bacterium]MCS5673973.1 riboflavin synthase [Acidimicrobiales bacterium]MED5540794.1 riboflavin synthase [Actinomycetota bacterium]|tara:strand:- start:5660 stop:6235 length:576 start_codon:yes stop_codon:yes gene_type:complete
MFTGLIEELGSFVSRDGERFRFSANQVLEGTTVDDSISVNGCCLTVVALGEDWWETDVVGETVQRTSLGQLTPGDPVNFERAVRYADRLGGHMVQGHIDGVGTVVTPGSDLRIRTPEGLDRYLVEKGSITVDGVSLTCFDVHENSFSVALIPHTLAVTTLGSYSAGDSVNLEVDVIAKYVERLLAPHNGDN